jgi:hypothetical protein
MAGGQSVNSDHAIEAAMKLGAAFHKALHQTDDYSGSRVSIPGNQCSKVALSLTKDTCAIPTMAQEIWNRCNDPFLQPAGSVLDILAL